MAAQTRILTLDLGTQSVGLAEFKASQDGGLILANYRSTELLADPAADATRHAQARMAIGEMAAAMGIKGHAVNYAIASQSVFTRFVKLPSVGEEQVHDIVGFEAQQNVPYPINEVVWDYQLVQTEDANQVEVVIVAIKSDLLDDVNESVELGGLRASTVDVSPMALYNAFRYSYSDLAGCSLLIDIGARSTNLVFIEPKKVFSRSINTGGNTITAAIAKDFSIPFGQAEEQKKSDGFVSLGGAYADPDDPGAARISKITRNTMTRLHAEITRSISFYRSQQSGAQPIRVYLAGGGASMPYMREFFQEKFQMPVEFFNPLRNVTVASHLNVDELGHRAHTLGGLVGLALRGVGSCPMELNLRPPSVIRREKAAKQRPAFVLAALAFLAGLTAWWLYFERVTEITASVTEKLTPKVTGLKNFETKINAVQKDIEDQKEAAQPILRTVTERDYWARVLNDLHSRLPKEYVWITSITPENRHAAAPKPGTVPKPGAPAIPTAQGQGPRNNAPRDEVVLQVAGLYLENDRGPLVVDDFITQLKSSELYTVDTDKIVRTVPNTEQWAYEYSFPLVLKNPINIPTIANK